MPSHYDGTSSSEGKSIYTLVSSTTNTLVPSVADSSATLVPPSSTASPSRPRSASPKPSFWQKLKAENEQRKQSERQTMRPKEATQINGYGSEDTPYAYSDGAMMELLMNGVVDPKTRKSREEAEKLFNTGKRYDSASKRGK